MFPGKRHDKIRGDVGRRSSGGSTAKQRAR